MNQYVVKNCPGYSPEPTKYGNACKTWCSSKPCQKRDNCIIKQLIEKCNTYIDSPAVEIAISAKRELAMQIKEMLRIEETQ